MIALGGRLSKGVGRLGRALGLDLPLALTLSIAALATWTFGVLADDVLDGDPIVDWDAAVSAWVHGHATPRGGRIFGAITQLGNSTFTLMMAAAIAPALWRRRAMFVGWIAAFSGGVVIERVVKIVVRRVRPPTAAAFMHVDSFSFPSAHATASMVAYTMLAYALVRLTDAGLGGRLLFYLGAALIISAVGLSRVYFGVHYPSDVVAGFAVGLAWVAICLAGIRLAERKGIARDS